MYVYVKVSPGRFVRVWSDISWADWEFAVELSINSTGSYPCFR